ncbi:MAG TPA: PRC-barrel domain-containing protein [Chloroflexota bacterium]|nr:PRC-barrel domain-containing protein [Chloroflexota bacterium]
MASIGTATLRRLSDSQLTVAHPDEDVRGRKVLDKAGEEIGKVDDLLIDDRDKKVRFLRVESGGFLGLGNTQTLIPIDAVTKVTSDAVHIDHTREHVAGGPGYNPELIADQLYWGGIYGYYGYPPYWSAGYMYPPFPWYRY